MLVEAFALITSVPLKPEIPPMAPSVFAVLVISKIWSPRFVVSTASTCDFRTLFADAVLGVVSHTTVFPPLSSCRPLSATTGGCRGSLAGLLKLGYYKHSFVVLICSRGRT
jgi:hypothetical protein